MQKRFFETDTPFFSFLPSSTVTCLGHVLDERVTVRDLSWEHNLTIPVQFSKPTKKDLRPSHLHEMAAGAVDKTWKFDLFYYAIIAFDCKNFNIHHSTRYLFNTTILNLIFLPLQDFPTLNFYGNYGGNANTLIWTFCQMPEVRIPVKFICALIHL